MKNSNFREFVQHIWCFERHLSAYSRFNTPLNRSTIVQCDRWNDKKLTIFRTSNSTESNNTSQKIFSLFCSQTSNVAVIALNRNVVELCLYGIKFLVQSIWCYFWLFTHFSKFTSNLLPNHSIKVHFVHCTSCRLIEANDEKKALSMLHVVGTEWP